MNSMNPDVLNRWLRQPKLCFLSFVLLGGLLVPCVRGQDDFVGDGSSEGDEEKVTRVQYALILPEEKMPEIVAPEEKNPFESADDLARKNDPGDSEENTVRDILLKLPVVGVTYTTHGSRIGVGGGQTDGLASEGPSDPDRCGTHGSVSFAWTSHGRTVDRRGGRSFCWNETWSDPWAEGSAHNRFDEWAGKRAERHGECAQSGRG